eukprot:TRINITY_DN7812_c0_g2_i2.p1 TRINITY_DN7812_c0_g2~~TRINITY_DN7812_c0_g2_i2.p1  ORF type:complete len:313 (+),score=64.89 TRINITY_DN7812_c0_g2_i2:453-1391(+)
MAEVAECMRTIIFEFERVSSGSLFFYSHDMRFILKTIPKREAKLMRKLLPDYVEHISKNENTLLPRFFGLHRVKPLKGRQVRFVVMGNVFATRRKLHERYDLKGSTFGRRVSPAELQKENITFKDLDFRERRGHLFLGAAARGPLIEQLRRDATFLAKLGVMDYSLLVGVHHENQEDEDFSPPPSGPGSPIANIVTTTVTTTTTATTTASSTTYATTQVETTSSTPVTATEPFHSIFQVSDGGMLGIDEAGNATGEMYYLGVIDILMLYTLRKRVEHTYKVVRYNSKPEEVSSIAPVDYAARFMNFMTDIIV